MYFVVYDLRSKVYNLYDQINKKLIISRDIQFDEVAWEWHSQGEPRNMLTLIEPHEDRKEQEKKEDGERSSSDMEDM